jgi:hypothetical protein
MNLIDEAESLLLYQFSHSPKLKALVKNLIKPFQELLDSIEALHHGQYIKDAHGPRLDILGAIVGQPRRNMDDSDYRAWIDVGIKLNNGSGTAEDVLTILKILYRNSADFLMHEHRNDIYFTLFKRPIAPMGAVFDIVQSATPITTTCHFICADGEPSFRFDVAPFEPSTLADFYEENL